MISLKVLSTAAALALLVPMLAPNSSLAAPPKGGRPSGGAPHFSGGGGPHFSGGGAPHFSGGGAPHFSGGGGPRFSGGGGGGYRRGGGGFIPGAVAGAVIGGAIASQGYGYGPGYYAPGYYDDQYYDDSVAVGPDVGGDDSVAWCMQTYRSYDPRTGTYLGNDGYRHPCP